MHDCHPEAEGLKDLVFLMSGASTGSFARVRAQDDRLPKEIAYTTKPWLELAVVVDADSVVRRHSTPDSHAPRGTQKGAGLA
jgi:hypothetical protein